MLTRGALRTGAGRTILGRWPPPCSPRRIVLHGPSAPQLPLVLDSPHSGFAFPGRLRLARSASSTCAKARTASSTSSGCRRPSAASALIAALAPRTYIDFNRHAGDIDLALIEGGRWPGEHVPSGKARLGKALVWRTLDDGRAIYDRKLSVDEVRAADRALPPAVPRRGARPHRGDARALRPQLAHRLPLDERRRRRPGRRRRRAARAPTSSSATATARPATPASPSSCAACSPASATTSSQRSVQGRRARARLLRPGRGPA